METNDAQPNQSKGFARVLLPGIAAIALLIGMWLFVPPKYFLLVSFTIIALLAIIEAKYGHKFFLKSHGTDSKKQNEK